MIIHSFTTESGKAYLVKLEPGQADGGRDKFTLFSVDTSGKSNILACVFHGPETLDMMLAQLLEVQKKYEAWKRKQISSPESETRRIELDQ